MPAQQSKLDMLLEVLACPKCKEEVRYDKKTPALLCDRCRLKFSILENDVPNMLLKDAKEF